MTIKDQLYDCYINNKSIYIDLEISKNVTLEDVFTIIYLVTSNTCVLELDDDFTDEFSIDECVDDVNVTIHDITNIGESIMLFIIYHPDLNNLFIYTKDGQYEYGESGDDWVEFQDLATQFGIINFELTRHIMEQLGIYYKPYLIDADIAVKNYLGLCNTKSARLV